MYIKIVYSTVHTPYFACSPVLIWIFSPFTALCITVQQSGGQTFQPSQFDRDSPDLMCCLPLSQFFVKFSQFTIKFWKQGRKWLICRIVFFFLRSRIISLPVSLKHRVLWRLVRPAVLLDLPVAEPKWHRKWHLRELPKFVKFPGGTCPRSLLEARTLSAIDYSLLSIQRGWNPWEGQYITRVIVKFYFHSLVWAQLFESRLTLNRNGVFNLFCWKRLWKS